MKHMQQIAKAVTVLLILLSTIIASGQSVDALFSQKKMKRDLEVFKEIRLKANSGLYKYRTKEQIDSSYRWAENEINNFGQGTDWQNELYRSAAIQNHSISLSGGNKSTQYSVSGNYFNQEGLISNSNFERFSWRTNLDSQLTDWLKVGTSLSITRSINNSVAVGNGVGTNAGPVNGALSFSPTLTVFDSEGNYSSDLLGGATDNPIAKALETTDETKITRLIGNSYFDFSLAKNLKWRTSVGADLFFNKRNYYVSRLVIPGSSFNGYGSLGDNNSTTWNVSNTLTFSPSIGDENNFSILFGNDIQKNRTEISLLSASNFISDDNGVGAINLAEGFPPTVDFSEWSILSYFGRITYDWKNKVFVTATGRVDGSSRFAINNKYAFFPSGAIAYKLSEEPFLKESNTINNLKLRFGYGITGNQEIGVYRSLALFGIDDVRNGYTFGGDLGNPIIPLGLENPDLQWETTEQFNAGLDLSLWNYRVNFTADYYIKNTSDLLLEFPVPPNSGVRTQLRNAGALRNSGLELSVNTVNIDRDFRWTTDFNISFNNNEVTDLAGLDEILLGDATGIVQNQAAVQISEGNPVGSFYGYQFDGIYQTQEELDNSANYNGADVGLFKYKDISGPDGVPDGVVDGLDRTVLGNSQPDFFGGFNNSFSYKGLSLDVFFNFSFGNDVLNANLENLASSNVLSNNLAIVNDYWTGEGTSTTVQRPIENNPFSVVSSRLIEDGSFIRARLVRLGYELPVDRMRLDFLRKLVIYASAENLFTITDYSGIDPEVNTFARTGISGIDSGAYPRARTILLGLKIGL